MSTRATLAEPVVVAKFWANRKGDAVFIQIKEFEGHVLIDLRKHFKDDDGRLLPTKKGIALAIARLPDLAKAINQAVNKSIELGLISKSAEGGNE
jgi:Transcriptional Coactivator p15 (PC4)